MLEFDGVFGLLLLGLWVHAIIDVVRADAGEVRHLPKQTWLFLVISLPDIGALVWMAAGRPERPVARFAEYSARPARRPLGPEDSPDFAAWAQTAHPTLPEPEEPTPTSAEPATDEDPPASQA
ncbi:MAG TPA: PLDc N-terminal domain-containing protein [Acidimicrobiales bacterium]|nr:PLDc N-terminal domain-containing protein [Acidimicrobiales bacterium]